MAKRAPESSSALRMVKDLDHAIQEMHVARSELARVSEHTWTYGYQRRAALIDPMARLSLVRRYLDQLIAANKPRQQ
jgi:hypothetical protein